MGQRLVQWQDPGASPITAALGTVTDAAAAEKLLEAMVRQAAASGVAEDMAVEALSGFIAKGGFLDLVGVTAAR